MNKQKNPHHFSKAKLSDVYKLKHFASIRYLFLNIFMHVKFSSSFARSRAWFISRDKRWRKTFQKLNHITLTSFSRFPTNFHCAAGIKRVTGRRWKMFFLLSSLVGSKKVSWTRMRWDVNGKMPISTCHEWFFFLQHFPQRRWKHSRLPQLRQNIKVKLICGGENTIMPPLLHAL